MIQLFRPFLSGLSDRQCAKPTNQPAALMRGEHEVEALRLGGPALFAAVSHLGREAVASCRDTDTRQPDGMTSTGARGESDSRAER